MTTTQHAANAHAKNQHMHGQPHDEQIMVIKRSTLLGTQEWQGLKCDSLEHYLNQIRTNHEFMPRTPMESDPTYKQIIPYLIFTHKNRYFLMQRQAHATEQRLKNKMSLGIGGHLRQEDINGDDFFGWAQREFHEEVCYDGTLSMRFLGLLNDNSNAVGQVHIGLVMILEGDSNKISVKSELKNGTLVSIDECSLHYDNLESWSQIVFQTLR